MPRRAVPTEVTDKLLHLVGWLNDLVPRGGDEKAPRARGASIGRSESAKETGERACFGTHAADPVPPATSG